MPNIHTLSGNSQYSSDDENATWDTPFLSDRNSTSTTTTNNTLQGPSTIPEDSFWSLNVNPSELQPYHLIFMSLGLNLFVGNPCSKIRLKDYLRLLFTALFWISVLDVIVFVVELVVCGVNFPLRTFFLPSLKDSSKLIDMGAKVQPLIRDNLELYRLVVPIFLHGGPFHLFFNLLVQLSFGLGFERHWQIWRVVPVYFIGGIAGNLLSCVTSSPRAVSVGASGALLSLFGAKFANLLIRWPTFSQSQRVQYLTWIVFIVLFSFMFSMSENVDLGAHLGGIMMGFFLGLILFCRDRKESTLKWKIVCAGVGTLSAVLFFVIVGILVGFGLTLWR